MGLANSMALQLAGITEYTEDPNGGAIMKTISGGKNFNIILVSQDAPVNTVGS